MSRRSRSAPQAAPAPAADAEQPAVKAINLALQGGGAHGAFTWGVLDRLLEDPRLRIEGICGTSAGAMNAVALAHGLATGGREGARATLDRFWRALAAAGRRSPIQRGPIDHLLGSWRLDYSPGYVAFDLLSRTLSPYQLNPSSYNPLAEILDEVVDFEAVHACRSVKLYVCATNVRTGKIKVFENRELSAAAVLASACLPFMFQAVMVDGEHYWDGGYMGNPAIFPLIYGCASADVLIVQINPLRRDRLPTTARDIMDRVNEISVNSSLMREMRAIAFVTRLIDDGKLAAAEYKRMLIHLVEADAALGPLGASSKLNAELAFLEHLKAIGRRTCDAWLERNFDALGNRSTVDLTATYL